MTRSFGFWAQRVAAALLVGVASVVAVMVIVAIVSGGPTPQPPLAREGEAPPPCPAGGVSKPSQVLVLANDPEAPARVTVHVGQVIELKFAGFQGLHPLAPVQRPGLTCSLGTLPGAPNSTLLVRAVQTGTVRFFTMTCPYGHCDAIPFYGTVTIQ